MPKSSKRQREASGSGGATAEAHPYRRGRSQTTRAAAPTSPVKATGGGRADSSLQQAEADPVMKVEETKSSKRRRRSKNRVRGTPLASPAKPNPLTETPVNEAEPSEVVRIKGEPGEIVPIVKKSTKTSQLVGASHGHALVAPEQTNPNANPAVDNQVQQEMQRKYIESQLAAEQELKALRLRVVELEKERDDGMKAVEEERKKVAEKENVS